MCYICYTFLFGDAKLTKKSEQPKSNELTLLLVELKSKKMLEKARSCDKSIIFAYEISIKE